MFSRPKFLFLVSLLFVALLNPKFNPYLLFIFLIFYHSIILSLATNSYCTTLNLKMYVYVGIDKVNYALVSYMIRLVQ